MTNFVLILIPFIYAVSIRFSSMKYFGSILDFTKQRNEDLMRVYHQKLVEAHFIVKPKIFKLVAESPASRFWVSEERAAVVVSAILSGNEDWDLLRKHRSVFRMRANKREMFLEIARRVKELQEEFPDKTIYDLTSIVVNQPAPKFYLSARTVGEFIYRIKNGWYD